MQIAFEIFRGLHDIPEDKQEEFTINTFRIPFGRARMVPVSQQTDQAITNNNGDEPTPEQIAIWSAQAKAVWAARLKAYGPGARQVTVPAESAE